MMNGVWSMVMKEEDYVILQLKHSIELPSLVVRLKRFFRWLITLDHFLSDLVDMRKSYVETSRIASSLSMARTCTAKYPIDRWMSKIDSTR